LGKNYEQPRINPKKSLKKKPQEYFKYVKTKVTSALKESLKGKILSSKNDKKKSFKKFQKNNKEF